MVQDQNPKLWHPARFTHGSIHGSGDGPFGPDEVKQHTVIILNNPLENRNLLVDVCIEGMHHIKARDAGFMADIIGQLVALYVPMAEQTDFMICTLREKKKPSVSVIRVFVGYFFVDQSSSSPTPYAETWTLYVSTWRNTIEAKT